MSSARTFKRIFAGSLGTTPSARCFYCFLLLILQKSYEMGTFIIAPILHNRKLRLTDFQRLAQILLVMTDGARFGPRSLGFQSQRPILAPEEGIRRHCWEDFKIFKFSSLW